MAGRGPAPKDPSERRRRNKTVPLTLLTGDGSKHGPELPDAYEWPPATLAWWEAWRPLNGQGIRSARREIRATPEDRARLRLAVTECAGNQRVTRGGGIMTDQGGG